MYTSVDAEEAELFDSENRLFLRFLRAEKRLYKVIQSQTLNAHYVGTGDTVAGVDQ